MALVLYSDGRKEVCNVVSSLQRTAAIKVVISLWTSGDIATSLNKYRSHLSDSTELFQKWESLEDCVKCNIEKLVLPQTVKKELLNLVKPIGMEIVKWKRMHKGECNKACSCNMNLLNKFHWTHLGTINKKKTAKLLVDDCDLDITFRCELACVYSFESDVKKLWNEYKAKASNSSGTNRCKYLSAEEVGWRSIVGFWDCVMKGRNPKDKEYVEINRHKYTAHVPLGQIIGDAAFSGFISAAEYLLQQLMPVTKESLLYKYAAVALASSDNLHQYKNDYSAEVIFFWLTMLNEQGQHIVIEKYATGVLSCFLERPWQESFMKAAARLIHVLTGSQFEKVLKCIIWKIMCGCEDYNYRSLFTEFWKQGFDTHKHHVIHECASDWELLGRLFYIGDRHNIQLIIDNATVEEKKAIVSYVEENTREDHYVGLYISGCFGKVESCVLLSNLFVFLKAFVQEKRVLENLCVDPTKKLCTSSR